MGTINAAAATMPHAHATMAGATGAAHTAGHKVEPKLPQAHDPRFMDLTVGNAAQAREMGRYRQAGGPGYGGQEGEDVDNQKDKNEIIDKTDANHLPQYGVLPGQNYVQTIQSYTGLSAIKDLAGMQGFPITDADWAAIVALQDQGGAPVLATVSYLTGLVDEPPAGLPASIASKRDAVSTFQIPGAGTTVAQAAINPKDVSGNNIARSHHSADWFATYRKAMDTGIPADWAYALALSDDGTSGSGRFNGFNNQDGNSTGANDGEDAYFKMVAVASQQLGRPDLFNTMLTSGHAHTALDPGVMTEPKINKLIGWNPPGDQTMSPERVEAIRQYYLRPDVDVDQGDFRRHVGTLPEGLRSQLDFTGVQFEAEEQNGGGGGGDGAGKQQDTGPLTGAGTGVVTGGGEISPVGLPGSPTIATRPGLDQLGAGGPFQVIDSQTSKLDKRLQDQMMTAFIEAIMAANDNPFLKEKDERTAFNDGAVKGVEFLKDAIAVDPTKVMDLKGELATALADGTLSDTERASLADKLAEAGMADVATAVEDGTATDAEIATLQEQVDGAASAKLKKDVTAAMEDGTLTPEERATIETRLGKGGLDALEAGVKDGTVTKDELEAIHEGATADEAAKAPTAGAPTDDTSIGATDATTGATEVVGDAPTDPAKPTGAKDDAKSGAGDTGTKSSDKADGTKGGKAQGNGTKDDGPKGDGATNADKPAGDGAKRDAPKREPAAA